MLHFADIIEIIYACAIELSQNAVTVNLNVCFFFVFGKTARKNKNKKKNGIQEFGMAVGFKLANEIN